MAPPYRAPFIILVLVLVAKNRAYVRLWTPHFHSKLHCKFHSHFSSHENEPCRLCLKLYNHTYKDILLKIWIHKVFTIYCILFEYFLYHYNKYQQQQQQQKKKEQQPTQRVSFISFFLYFFTFFESSFHPTICTMNEFGFSVFQLSVSRFTQFSFSLFSICRPDHDLFMGSSRNGTKPTEYCIRVSRTVIRVCTYFPSVIFVGVKSRGL